MMFSESFVEHEQVGGCQVPEVTFVSRQMSLLFQPVVASGVNDTAVVGKNKINPICRCEFQPISKGYFQPDMGQRTHRFIDSFVHLLIENWVGEFVAESGEVIIRSIG